MNLFLSSLASVGLPLSQATKVIVDHGYVILEGTGTEFFIYYLCTKSAIIMAFNDKIRGNSIRDNSLASIGLRTTPTDHPKADIMEMSFVIEWVDGELPTSSADEDQIWFQESSPSLLDKVNYLTGNVAIREMKRGEKMLMDKFKQSHDASQFKAIYENGTARLLTNVKETFRASIQAKKGEIFEMFAGRTWANPESKLVHLEEIGNKSFAIEDAAKGNCESLESLGFKGNCMGDIWIEQL